jgi:hypothetical protein
VSRNRVQEERNNSSESYHPAAIQALARFGEQKDASIWRKKGIFKLQTGRRDRDETVFYRLRSFLVHLRRKLRAGK